MIAEGVSSGLSAAVSLEPSTLPKGFSSVVGATLISIRGHFRRYRLTMGAQPNGRAVQSTKDKPNGHMNGRITSKKRIEPKKRKLNVANRTLSLISRYEQDKEFFST